MPEFFVKLRFQQRLLILLLALMLGFTVLSVFSLLVLLCQGINTVAPIQEEMAWRLLIGIALFSFALIITGFVWLAVRRPRVGDLARMVEARNPELKESLSTALEIQEKHGGPQGELQEALFRQVELATADINIKRESLPKLVHPALVLALIAVAMLLSDIAGKSDFVLKARYYQIDRLQATATGLLVDPGDADIPRADDLRVEVMITRWEKTPEILFEQAGEVERYPMTLNAEGMAQFTFFGVTEPIQYRVETPSSRSPWFTISVYDPPEIDELAIVTTPPAYTLEDATSFSRLVDLLVPEGTRIVIELKTQQGVTGHVRWSGETIVLKAEGDALMAGFTAEQDGDYQIVLKNSEGRMRVTPSFDVDVIPDEPPVIEIVEPGKDTMSKPDGAVPLTLYSGDDYGISQVELHVAVSGLPRSPIVLFETNKDFPREKELLSALELVRQNAEHGDIVTYYVVARDNKQPVPQSSQSDVFFIEVLRELPENNPEDVPPEDGGGGDGPQDEVRIRAIIVELKRLIRETHAAMPLEGARRDEASQALGTGIAEVRKETTQIFEKLTNMFIQMYFQGNEDGRVMADYLVNAMERMLDAERSANEGDLQWVGPPLQEALSNMLIVESFASSLPQMQSSQSGQGQPSEGQGQGEQQQQPPESSQGKMSLAEMQKALDQLKELSDEQAIQNSDFDRADGQNMSEAEQQELADAQNAIEQQVGELEQLLKQGDLEKTSLTRDSLSDARKSMRGATGSAEKGDLGAANRNGMRARESLMQASGMLEDLIAQEAGGILSGLSQKASQLAQGQGKAKGQSEEAAASGAGTAEATQLRNQQEQIQQQYEQLLAEMARESVNLESSFPEVGEALAQAARNAKRSNTEGQMQRAENALLYERFDRAAQSQGQAQEQLQAMAGAIQSAAGELPGMTSSQLRQLAESIQRAQKQTQQGNAQGQQGDGEAEAESWEVTEATKSEISKLGSQLGKAGKALKNTRLVELGQNLEATHEGNSDSSMTPNQISPMLDQASRIIRDYMRSEWVDERTRLNRTSAPPPEQYRRLVEEYFKNLAEEQ